MRLQSINRYVFYCVSIRDHLTSTIFCNLVLSNILSTIMFVITLLLAIANITMRSCY